MSLVCEALIIANPIKSWNPRVLTSFLLINRWKWNFLEKHVAISYCYQLSNVKNLSFFFILSLFHFLFLLFLFLVFFFFFTSRLRFSRTTFWPISPTTFSFIPTCRYSSRRIRKRGNKSFQSNFFAIVKRHFFPSFL